MTLRLNRNQWHANCTYFIMREAINPLSNTSTDDLAANQPSRFLVSVIMQSKPSSSKWVEEVWDAIGLVVLTDEQGKHNVKQIIQGDSKQLIYSGLTIRLFLDECESYYHNLMSPEPGCFIVAREEDAEGNESDVPIPFLVSLSFDEAHAYLEGDDIVYSVAIPPELYRWTEAYVLENYSAEKRKKRKRKDWSASLKKANEES